MYLDLLKFKEYFIDRLRIYMYGVIMLYIVEKSFAKLERDFMSLFRV